MESLNQSHIRSILTRALPELDRRLLVADIDLLTAGLDKQTGSLPERITALLAKAAEFRFHLFTRFQELTATLPKLRTESEKKQLMMDFLRESTPSADFQEDRRAFDRWMDITAVRERARVAMHESDRRSELLLHLLRDTLVEVLAPLSPEQAAGLWNNLHISRHLENELNDSPRWRNQVTVLKVWEGVCRSVQEKTWRPLWSENWNQRIWNLLSSPEEHVWLQVEAFRLCAIVEPSHALAMIHHRLMSPSPAREDVFVRASLLDVAERQFPADDFARVVTDVIRRPDPSEYVMISACRKLASLPMASCLPLLSDLLQAEARPDLTDKIQAAAAISLEAVTVASVSAGSKNTYTAELQSLRENALSAARSPRFQLALAEGLGKAALAHAEFEPGDRLDEFDHRILLDLDRIIGSESYAERVRRKASEIRETVILNRNPAARTLYESILSEGRSLAPGGSFRIPADWVPDETLLGRVLARISVTDYGYYAQPQDGGYRIWRGELFRRHLWRLLHELNHLDPAKRQGFVHTTGRIYPGIIRAHARYLAETTETKVPGERVFFRNEYSWRPFIPTIDDILSATRSQLAGKMIRLFSSEGVFELTGPKALSDRLSLWWFITLNYGNLVRKRNYDLEDVQSGHSRNFMQVLQEDFGLTVDFKPHAYEYAGKTWSVVDPHMSAHMFPLLRTGLDWRPLS